MTSQVMVPMTSRLHGLGMKKILPILVLLPFTVFSVEVILAKGYFGFLSVAAQEPWGMQMLLDLAIALFLVGAWIRNDARDRGLPSLPYLLLLPFLGSIGALAYLVHRAFAAPATPATPATSPPSPARLF